MIRCAEPSRLAGAGPDRRTGDAPAAAVVRARQGGAAGRRHAAGAAHPALAARAGRRRASCSTCITAPTPSRAIVGDGSAHRPRGALLVGARGPGLGRRTGARRPAARGRSLPDRQRRHAGRRRPRGARDAARRHQCARHDGGGRRPPGYNGVVADASGIVRGFWHANPGAFHFIGVQAVNASVFAGVDPDTKSETVHGIYPDLIASRPGALRVFQTGAEFFDIGIAARLPRDRDRRSRHAKASRSIAAATARSRADASLTNTMLWDRVSRSAPARADRVRRRRRRDAFPRARNCRAVRS